MNNSFTAYSAGTGRVLYCGEAYDPSVLQTDSILILIGKKFSDGWIENGLNHLPPEAPSHYHVFDYSAKQWIDPRTQESEWALVRAERDRRLLSCDWTQLPDVPLATKEVWAVYRQALRDITEQVDPFNVQWPNSPS